MTTALAPIVLFAYNRPMHLRRTLEALQANALATESDLFVYSDAPRSEADRVAVDEVRRIIDATSGFRSICVVKREHNVGLAANVIEGVTTLTRRYGKVIVLEDDLITSPYFLTFMNEGLRLYADDERVMNVQGHVLHTRKPLPLTFFIRFANSWGWGTWHRAWQKFEADGRVLLAELEERELTRRFDFDGRYPFTRMLRRQIAGQNHSWAIRWNATIFLRGGLSLNAGHSLVKNIGTDGSGTNFTSEAGYYTVLYDSAPLPIDPHQPVEENAEARRAIGAIYAYEYSKITKGLRLLRRFWNRLFARKKTRD